MDLPNLYPMAGLGDRWGVDVMVAPSSYVASHPSVQVVVAAAASCDTSEPVHTTAGGGGGAGRGHGSGGGRVGAGARVVVIQPGVNASLFDPAGDVECAPCHGARSFRRGAPSQAGAEGRAEDGAESRTPLDRFRCGLCPTVAFFARLAPEKSPGLFLRAAAVIAERWPFANFLVIGDGRGQEESLQPALL